PRRRPRLPRAGRDARADRSRSGEFDPHSLEGLALVLGLRDAYVPYLGRRTHVGPTVRLLVESLDLDHTDRVHRLGDQVHLRTDQVGIGERLGPREEADPYRAVGRELRVQLLLDLATELRVDRLEFEVH